jgi:ureidoglycolate lyase
LSNVVSETIRPEPLTRDAFAPYGDVLQAPDLIERRNFVVDLISLRPKARLNMSLVRAPIIDSTRDITELEYHPYSAQAFFPIDVESYVVLVALNGRNGRPSLSSLKVYIATRHQGICYRPGVWHLGMATIHRPGAFALLVHEDGMANDFVFRGVPAFRILIP